MADGDRSEGPGQPEADQVSMHEPELGSQNGNGSSQNHGAGGFVVPPLHRFLQGTPRRYFMEFVSNFR